ncbi:MAG TPA: glycosyltransferase [Methylomirabilota bacterium]|nr:glycosyltransferase [Methylomirabilota bacterium]
MRILMVAPEPFFEPRGTALSVYHRLKALGELGHDVHLITYPIGQAVALPRVRIFRAPGLPFLRRVRVGPSWAKIPLDVLLFLRVLARLARERYDVIHTHEEASLLGALLRRLVGLRHIYDMHSSLPQQFENFAFTNSRVTIRVWTAMEGWAVKASDLVICICPSLTDVVKAIDPERPVLTIENPMLFEGQAVPDATVADLRRQWGLAGRPVVLYTGTFEAYQGVDLLLRSVPRVRATTPDVRVVVVGGEARQIAPMRALAAELGVADVVVFTGQRPLAEMPTYFELADILVSPRTAGTNTPLKIYSYLASGRPIVATRILAHTQVLSDEVAVLTAPTPDGVAAGINRLLADDALAATLAKQARAFAEARFSQGAYRAKVAEAYERLAALSGRA